METYFIKFLFRKKINNSCNIALEYEENIGNIFLLSETYLGYRIRDNNNAWQVKMVAHSISNLSDSEKKIKP